MKDKQFYLNKANTILGMYNEKGKGGFHSKFSTTDVISETELLFFGFNQDYPALSDLKELKENYLEYTRKGTDVSENVRQHVLRFINFVNDYN